ncbi:alpha/beta hydrolase [Lutibaculum baratangense]|uniref:Palmitoyl-protein thioesterase ABHD10, mitochondrial n=1 Tax=Lutibaculum baratangense AMV1 TaxID=631454 RepID=V4RIH9_9HYPH|nr:alpha/beta hydrolase [Lutibaculum baratangense]ESR25891.1 2-hydroxymuconic semialdehyde hydrolase [Lutibaculum baratangense AMV1]
MAEAEYHEIPLGEGENARRIALKLRRGKGPTLVWLGGFRSDMAGTKATRLDQWAEAHGRACLLFDYSGHGQSSGRFEDGTIGTWLHDAAEAVAQCAGQSPLLVGSSMGGWIASLLALRMKVEGHPPHGLVLIAPALDFTERLMWDLFSEEQKREIMETGQWMRPSEYDGPYPITRKLIEEGRRHLLLDRDLIEFGCPVHILQGRLDEDVPLDHTLDIVTRLACDDVTVSIVHDGDHRLSREQDIALLLESVETMIRGDHMPA